MTDEKKDLTNIMDYAKRMQDEGTAPPAPPGSVMEEQKIDQIDDFISLDDFSKANPAPTTHAEISLLSSNDEFVTTPDVAGAPTGMNLDFTPDDSPPAPEPSFTAPPEPSGSETIVDAPTVNEIGDEPLRPAVREPAPEAKVGLEKVRQYSEQMNPVRSAVPAGYPFSLLITGHLLPEEKERLLDILSRENMGIREIDLEPQFECGKILIPRISEYAGVLIVSALRSTRARMRLGPSDTIFATPDTQNTLEENFDNGEHSSDTYSGDGQHPAENLPLTTEATIPGLPHFIVIDVVTASAILKTQVVENESSSEYQQILEALQREIKYKAFRKGATAILNFNVQLTGLNLSTQYRILVSGAAVKGS